MNASNKRPPQSNEIETVFRRLERPAWVVTAQAGERRGGLVATWVSQASLDPARPTVLIGLAPNHHTAELVEASQSFGLHLLRVEQAELALGFCLASGRQVDKLAGHATRPGESGAPLLADCQAWLDCRVYARLATCDRTYFWADVLAGESHGEEPPLTDHTLIAAATPEQRQTLGNDRASDLALHQPLAEAWRQHLPAWLAPAGP